MSQKDLGDEFEKLETAVRNSVQFGGGTDSRAMLGIALLGQAIVRLDKTSTQLATANVKLTKMYTWLTGAILLVSIIQIGLMLRGR